MIARHDPAYFAKRKVSKRKDTRRSVSPLWGGLICPQKPVGLNSLCSNSQPPSFKELFPGSASLHPGYAARDHESLKSSEPRP